MSPPNSAAPETDYVQVPSNSSSQEDEVLDEDIEVVVPPDGGWGWVVVFASFMSNMIVDGIIFSFGAFLKPISKEFQVTEAHVALVGSLMSGFYLIAGPFASAVANRYGFRVVAIGGSILGAAAFAASYFAPNVNYLYVVFGVLGGIGFGFIYVPAVITVGFYFEKWRALATGIGVCGSGIGTFLFAPITTALINNLGWRTALLCQGAIVTLCAGFGLLYRPLKPKKVSDIKAEKPELRMDPHELPPKAREALEAMDKYSDNKLKSDVYHTISIPQQRVLDIYSYEKRLSVPFFANEIKPEDFDVEEFLLENSNAPTVPNTEDISRPMYRDDIFFSASLTRLPQYTSRTSLAYNISVTKLPTKNDIEEEKTKSCVCPEAIKRTLSTMLDFSLLKSPTFLILAFGGFFTMMGFYIPFMYLVDRADSEGMAKNYTLFLISAIGISNTIGRVLCGILSSFPGVNALFVTNAALTIGGIATMFSGFALTPEYQFTYTTIFGLSTACFASLRSIIVVDLLGLEKLTNAFGLLLLFQGVAAAIGSPLAGAFKILTGSYDAAFYLSGGVILFSAVMCYPLNYINKREMARKNRPITA